MEPLKRRSVQYLRGFYNYDHMRNPVNALKKPPFATPDPLHRTALGFGLSAILLSAAFVPGLYGVTVWFALVPALLAARRAPVARLAWVGWVAGYAQCLAVFYWITIVTGVGGALLPIYLGVYWPIFFISVETLKRYARVPRVLGVIALLPALEIVRGWLFTGLPWFYLGHSLYRWPRLIQAADLGGVLFVSAIVAAINALLAEAVALPARRRAAAVTAAVAIFAVNALYGAWRFEAVDERPGPTVAMVQPNVPQDLKITQTAADSARIFFDLANATLSAPARTADVIIWPETIMPGAINHENYVVASGMLELWQGSREAMLFDYLTAVGSLNEAKRLEAVKASMIDPDVVGVLEKTAGIDAGKALSGPALVSAVARTAGKPLVVGALAADFGEDGAATRVYNRVERFDADGRAGEYYDKVHLVPFGEYTPFREMWPALSRVVGKMMPVESLTYPGPEFRTFEIGGYRYGPAICFEDTFSYIGRRYRRMGADILLNVTNDGWFGGSFELEAHLANALFRAVETRMAVVRSANTGVSAIISPRGVVMARLADSTGADRRVKGLLVGGVSVSRSTSAYIVVGDWWLLAPLCAVAGWALAAFARRSRKA